MKFTQTNGAPFEKEEVDNEEKAEADAGSVDKEEAPRRFLGGRKGSEEEEEEKKGEEVGKYRPRASSYWKPGKWRK